MKERLSDLAEYIEDFLGVRTMRLLLLGLDKKLDQILHNQTEFKMSQSQFEADLAAQTAAVQALATEVSDGLAANATAIQALKDQIAAGTPVTAADLTTLESNTSAIAAATTALQAALNPAPAAPPADQNPPTP
jgi:hypothetical protein